jgi:hypothetical protein
VEEEEAAFNEALNVEPESETDLEEPEEQEEESVPE